MNTSNEGVMPQALEIYQFQYGVEEVAEVYRQLRKPLMTSMWMFAGVSVFLFILAAVSEMPVLTAFVGGYVLMGAVVYIKQLITHRTMWKGSEARILSNTYGYWVYPDCFMLSIYRNGEVVQTSKIYFNEVAQKQDSGNYLLMVVAGQVYILRKSDLMPQSVFYRL